MATTYLIDGYNLLHAMGVLGGRVGPHGLEKARARLLGLLHGAFGEEAGAVTVVFDAAQAPPGLAAEQDYRGVHVLFALGKQEADDVIEQEIRQASAPKSLQIVSDDHRIQQAGRRASARFRAASSSWNGSMSIARQKRRQRRSSRKRRKGFRRAKSAAGWRSLAIWIMIPSSRMRLGRTEVDLLPRSQTPFGNARWRNSVSHPASSRPVLLVPEMPLPQTAPAHIKSL